MRDLTQRQKEILEFIAQFTDENGFAPTVREICSHFNIAIRAVQDHIAALQKKGALIATRHRSRSFRVLDEFKSKKSQPVLSSIPIIHTGAVDDLLNPENIDGSVYKCATYIEPEKTYFAVHSADDAFRNLGILKGDLLVVEMTENYSDGTIVVAYHGGKFLVRRFDHAGEKPCLRTEDERYYSIYRNFKVLGALVEVSRNL